MWQQEAVQQLGQDDRHLALRGRGRRNDQGFHYTSFTSVDTFWGKLFE